MLNKLKPRSAPVNTQSKTCRHGKMEFLPNDVYIGRAFDLYGEHSELEVQFLLSLIDSSSVVVDVGANIGALTMPLAQKAARVLAFEPQSTLKTILETNLEVNDLSNVEVLSVGLGATQATATLPTLDYGARNNFGGVSLTNALEGVSVAVETLDSFDLAECSLIKVDVEGMEAVVIEGAQNTLRRCKPLLYVENDRPDKSPKLIELITSLGYNLYWHLPPLYNPNNFLGNSRNEFAGVVSVNMLGVPLGVELEQTKGLRKVAGPYDSWNGTRPAAVKPPNGWAGVARFGGIGDNLMAASAIGALKRKGLKVEVITSVECAWQVFEHNPNIDKLSVKTKSEIPTDMLAWQKWFKGRADEFDVFAHLSHSCEGLLAFFPASTQFNWPAHVRRKIANVNYLEMVHDIAGVGYDFGPLFYASEQEKVHALETKAKVGERVIALCMAGTRHDKLHPRLPAIVARLISEVQAPVVLIGSQERNFNDAKIIQEHVKATNGSDKGLHVAISSNPDENGYRAIDWPIRRTIAFAQACDIVIGPDTGVMWGVAFEVTPKIMLLSHASPENITKHWVNTVTLTADQTQVPCWPCHQLHDVPGTCTPNADNSGAACISDISVERVVRVVKELWR